MHELDYLEAKKQIKTARIAIFIIAGISAAFGLYLFFNNTEIRGYDSSILIDAIILIVFALFSYRYPLLGLSLALGYYIIGQIAMIIEKPEMIAKGVLVKFYIVYALVKGVKAAYSIRNYSVDVDIYDQINEIGKAEDEPEV